MRCETVVRVARFELASLSAEVFKTSVYAIPPYPQKLSLQVVRLELTSQSAAVVKTAMYSVSSYPQILVCCFKGAMVPSTGFEPVFPP